MNGGVDNFPLLILDAVVISYLHLEFTDAVFEESYRYSGVYDADMRRHEFIYSFIYTQTTVNRYVI